MVAARLTPRRTRVTLWRRASVGLVGVSFLLATAAPALAADGDLDPVFGTNGSVTTAIGARTDRAVAVAIQSDGKIVAVGYSDNGTSDEFALGRYNPNGSLDTSFGSGGLVTTDFGPYTDHAHAVAIQTDGKIVVAGYRSNATDTDFAIARYNADGSLDSSFGPSVNGKVVTAVGAGNDEINAMALQSDGKIVVAGQSAGTTLNRFIVARYTTGGSLDPTFGTGGKAITDIGPGSDAASAVAIQSDGKIVAAGRASNGTDRDFALARYNSNGTLDAGFGSGGTSTTAIGASDEEIDALALQSDGKIVAAGQTYNGRNTDFALARYATDGSLDTGFGSSGVVTTNIGHDDAAYGVGIQSDGKIVATGVAGSFYFGLARYTPNGVLDSTFGSAGTVITPLSKFGSDAYAMAIQSDGKIVAAGDAYNADYDMALARFLVGPATPWYQPDQRIKLSTKSFVGDNAYNTTAIAQTAATKARRGTNKTFVILVENDGSTTDTFTIHGTGAQKGFGVRFLQGSSGTTDITSQVVAGSYTTAALSPGAWATIRAIILVKPTAKVGTTKSWLVLATSSTSASQQDAVMAKVKVAS